MIQSSQQFVSRFLNYVHSIFFQSWRNSSLMAYLSGRIENKFLIVKTDYDNKCYQIRIRIKKYNKRNSYYPNFDFRLRIQLGFQTFNKTGTTQEWGFLSNTLSGRESNCILASSNPFPKPWSRSKAISHHNVYSNVHRADLASLKATRSSSFCPSSILGVGFNRP